MYFLLILSGSSGVYGTKDNAFIFSCSSGSNAFGDYGSTRKSFIFSLSNKEGLAPFKSMVTIPSKAIYRRSYYGPTFGEGHDIKIANNADSNKFSRTGFGNSYSVPSGVQDRYTILAGTQYFSPDDWEVLYLDTTGAKIN